MNVMALMPVRLLNLVVPLAARAATAMRTTGTAGSGRARPGAAAPLIGKRLRRRGVSCTTQRSTRATTPGTRTSTMATRTTTTRTTRPACVPSADPSPQAAASYTFERLVAAYTDCRRNKRNSASALAFEQQLEPRLWALHEELASGAYRPGPSICFVVTRPKPREVWAADFRDRVVHHLLYNHIAPRFHARFTADSCACIPGRGTLYAARRLEHQVRSATANWRHPAWYLKCDLANFFVAIDKTVLRAQLAARICPDTEAWWQRLADTVLLHDPRAAVQLRGSAAALSLVPPHKSLFNAPDHCGLPIGNLSSQFFANVYLDALDQHCKHRLRAPHYVRYVDDFVLVHPSAQWLNAALADVAAFLPQRLHAQLNPRKTVLQPAARGIDFVGHVIRPWHRCTRPGTVRAAVTRLEQLPADRLLAAGNSYLGLVRQAGKSHSDQARIANALRRRGHCVDAGLTKAYAMATKPPTEAAPPPGEPMTAPPPLLRAFPNRPPVTHFAQHDDGGRFAGPLCGQRAADGKGHARTTYTRLAERVTCRKCAKALAKLQPMETP
jgi:RNA-directed DNA polymerase